MRGMIYKDLCLFFKGIDKIVLLVDRKSVV